MDTLRHFLNDFSYIIGLLSVNFHRRQLIIDGGCFKGQFIKVSVRTVHAHFLPIHCACGFLCTVSCRMLQLQHNDYQVQNNIHAYDEWRV